MNRKLGLFVVLMGLFVVSLVFGGETRPASVEQDSISTSVDGDGLDVYFFYGRGCPHCANVEPFLAEMEQRYALQLHKHDIYGNRSCLSLFDDYSKMYGLPMGHRGVPTIFVSETYFVGDTAILDGFEEVVKKAITESPSVDKTLQVDSAKSVETETASVAGGLSIVAVTVAALVDAVSPCSIAILVFLIGARVLVANRRKRALKVGLAFCLSVFIAYFLFGLGLFTVVQVGGFSGIFSLLVGLIAVLAGIFYLKDVFWYGSGGFVMEVPGSLKPFLMKLLKGVTSPFGAFVMGFVVCLFELPCTGGPYLFILGQLADSTTRLQAIPLLLYYNLLFILPLIIVSLLLYSNLFSVGKAREWNEKNKRFLRLIGGLTMMALGLLALPTLPILRSIQTFLSIYKVAGLPLLTSIFLYFILFHKRPEHLENKLKGTLLLSILFSLLFVIPSPANLSGVEAQSGGLTITVKYNDGCPVYAAFVQVWKEIDAINEVCAGYTNTNGELTCPSSQLPICPHTYWVQIFKPDDVEKWFGPGIVDETCTGSVDADLTEDSCPSGYCVDGYCCDSACDGNCDRCDVLGSEGTCTDVDEECTGNCDYCHNGNCAANETICEALKCADCIGSGTSFSCTFDETEDGDCGPDYECSGLDTCSSTSSSFHATVLYSDDCPVEGYWILIKDIGSAEPVGGCYPTDINGYCETTLDPPLQGETWYAAEAWESFPDPPEKLCEPESGCLGAYGFQTDPDGNGEVTIPPDEPTYYPQGTEACGDSECDGFQYCIIPEVGNPYIECDSWDTECDTKKCCQCDGGTQANPTENYDETQCEDCDSYYLPEVATCTWDPDNNPYTWDYHPAIDSECQDLDTCTHESGYYDYTHSCSVDLCGAECDSDDDCASGVCKEDCTCASCVIKVQYQDGCPRSGADVIYLWPEPGDFIGITGEDGTVSCDHLPHPEEYLVQAWYSGEQFGIEEGLPIDESGCGSATVTDDSILDNDGNGVGDCHQPQWRSQGQNRSSIGKLQSNYLYTEARSYELDWAWLSTNEKGYWSNTTYMDMNDATSWTWSNFTWSNSSFTGTLSWKIYHNDTSGFTNVTNTMSFKVYDKPPCTNPITECCVIDQGGTYHLANDIQANGNCIVIQADANLLGDNHTISGDGTGIGINVTNSVGFPIILECKIKNFEVGILVDEDGHCGIGDGNVISNNFWGVILWSNTNFVAYNYITDNTVGVQPDTGYYNEIYNNYFRNEYNAYTPNNELNYWNTTKSPGPNIIGGPYIGGNYWSDYDGEDADGDGIGDTPYTVFGGTNKDYLPLIPPHGIAITNTTTSKTVVGTEYPVTINITSKNLGLHTETFNITAYANTTTIDTEEITLTSKDSTSTIFTWDTTGFEKGNYTITAYATTVPEEIETDDNTYTDGTIQVTIQGDVNGDGAVDIFDLSTVGQSYGKRKVKGEATIPPTGNGVNKNFTVRYKPVIPGSETVYLDGVPTTAYTMDYENGVIIFDTAPGAGVAATADYTQVGYNPEADITEDGFVDARDLAVVTWHWGETDP